MKKTLWALSLSGIMMFLVPSGWALPFVYTAPIDSIVDYGTGSPSEAAEKGYLAAYLGLTIPQLDLLYVFEKNEGIGDFDYKDLASGYNPGFVWDFAIIKIDGPNDYWYLFIDDNATLVGSGWAAALMNGDDILTTPAQGAVNGSFIFNQNNLGISHVSWFKPNEGFVPEPSALLLIGTGILGMGILVRRKFRK
jgi:hypothetical protein